MDQTTTLIPRAEPPHADPVNTSPVNTTPVNTTPVNTTPVQSAGSTPQPTSRPTLRGFVDPPLVASRGRSHLSRAATYLVIVVLGLLDAFLMRPVLMLVLDEAELGSYIAAFGLATAACVMMFYAGRLNAGAQGRGRRLSLVGSLLVLTWLSGGLFIAALRAVGTSTATEVTSSAMTASTSPVTLQSGLQAVLFFVIYLAIGLLTMTDAKEDRSDVFDARLITVGALQSTRTRLAQLDGLLTHLHDERARARMWLDELEARKATQFAASADLADHGAQHARLVIASYDQNPSTTGVTSLKHPENPLHADRD